jgi:hypothetical protein
MKLLIRPFWADFVFSGRPPVYKTALNQITERIDREKLLGLNLRFTQVAADLMPEPGWQPLVSFRAGYPTVNASPSPRRPAEAGLLQS